MRLQDALDCLSNATQQSILQEQSRRFRVSDGQTLAARLTDPAFLQQVWEQADAPEQKVLHFFLRHSMNGFVSRREWERAAGKDRLFDAGLNRLRRLGIVLTVRKMWSEIGYLMPREVREPFLSSLLPPPEKAYAYFSKLLPYYMTAGRGAQLDLFGLLLHLRENPVPLTQKGTLHRRYQKKLSPLLSLSDEHVSGICLPPLNREERQGLALTIALDLAWKLGLVRNEKQSVVLHEPRVQRWLELPSPLRWEEMYRLVEQQLLPHGEWWDALAFLMRQTPVDQWCSLQAQLGMLREAGFSVPDSGEAVERIRQEWLHPLLGLGWVELGEKEAGDLYWRWNPLPQQAEESGWYIDSAGEITIPPLVPLKKIWELSSFCPLQFDGPFVKGRLERKNMQAYLARGGTVEQATELLREGCVHPLPETVAVMIAQWGQSARQIRLEPCYRLRTATPGLFAEWKEIPEFQPFLKQIISPTECILTEGQHLELAELLRRYGYEPQVLQPSFPPLTAEGGNAAEPAPAQDGLFQVVRPWDGYAVENTFPELVQGMVQVAALPKMWTRHFQSYHPHTLRDLLKRAGELQLEVEIERRDQVRIQGVPSDLRVEMGYWMVGVQGEAGKKRLRLEDIARVRIVVPDHLYAERGT